MKPYCLAPEVYLSVAEEGAVVLDLENDDYIGLDSAQAGALALVVEEWPGVTASQTAATVNEAVALASSLCERGVLAPAGCARERSSELPILPVPRAELLPWEHMKGYRISAGDVLRFLLSLAVALILLRRCPFSRIVARVRSRRARHGRSAPFHAEDARRLVSAYYHIRAFVFAPKNRCLLDSLTLIEFLARYDLYPRWVIGVQVSPFGSHSWVQHESFVLNSPPTYVHAYQPILII